MSNFQFNNIFENKIVLLTGHTGFKGSWLTLWLHTLGARVIGYSKDIPTEPSHFKILGADNMCTSIVGTINDKENLLKIFKKYQPDIVFHLAAQSVVGYAYENPIETFESNVMGTVHVFECCRQTKSVKAIVNVTSDKCYQNDEQNIAFSESASMGGNDPYSCSKGAAELVTSCYRKSFFQDIQVYLASARAGNVIGGGDWTYDALIPDVINAIGKNEKVNIRSPYATRPWQFVLEPLSGYLLLGQKLLEEGKPFAEGWNFGPSYEKTINVLTMLDLFKQDWSTVQYNYNKDVDFYKEAKYLRLDCSKAEERMSWRPVWSIEKAVEKTVQWYRNYYEKGEVLSELHLQQYVDSAAKLAYKWAI